MAYTYRRFDKRQSTDSPPVYLSNKVVMLIWAALTYACFSSQSKANGVFFLEFQRDLGITAAEVSTIYSTSRGLIFSLGPIYGACLKLYGPRKVLMASSFMLSIGYGVGSQSHCYTTLFMFFSIIAGLGVGLAVLTIFTIIGQSFTTKRALANNIIAAGSSIVSIMFAPVMSKAIDEYTWHGAMLLEAAFLLNMFPCAWMTSKLYVVLTQERIPEEEEWKVVGSGKNAEAKIATEVKGNSTNIIIENITKLFDLRLISDPVFIAFTLATCGVKGSRIVQTMYLVRYAEYLGISNTQSSLFVSIYQAMFVIMCIAVGIITSKMHTDASKSGKNHVFKTSTITCFFLCAQMIVMAIPLVFPSYSGYLAYTITAGGLQGAVGNLPITIVAELFGSDRLPSALGFRSLAFGIFNFVLPPLIGYMIDESGSFHPVQYVGICCSLVGVILLQFVQRRIDARTKKHNSMKVKDTEGGGINSIFHSHQNVMRGFNFEKINIE